MMTLAQAHSLLPDSRLVGDGHTPILRVHSDTRTLRAGDLFVALKGERFDGNDFLSQAKASGAVAALAERGLGQLAGDAAGEAPGSGMPGLQVADTLHALQRLAAGWRARFHLPLIAVTGSNGKTTVTQMVAAILRAWLGTGALATAGNLNNHIGAPLTLLRLRQDDEVWHRAAVLELGMNHPGEIALLAHLAAPTVALVNNAQREHQEFMASVQAVAQENGQVITALGAGGTVVIPADDEFTPLWKSLASQRKVMTFASRGAADVTSDARWDSAALRWALTLNTPAGTVATTVALPGAHNVRNALAAAACALAAGAPLAAVQQGLAAFAPVAGRSHAQALTLAGRAVTLVDDSYNANPDSVLAAIDVLTAMPGPRWLILGDMGEVGSQGPQFHAEVGQRARDKAIEKVWAVGELSVHVQAHRHFNSVAELLAALPAELASSNPAVSVLVKGSRFMKMEQVVKALQMESARAA
jgi:UDP-N-acetylmuramoyl-tripeptide--D-alanyl-D-alanine ligase